MTRDENDELIKWIETHECPHCGHFSFKDCFAELRCKFKEGDETPLQEFERTCTLRNGTWVKR